VIAIILARGGSRRIPGKNIRDFMGKPIITYSIETALASDLFKMRHRKHHRIVVSTENQAIKEIACEAGALVHHRKPEFAEDNVGTQTVAQNVLGESVFLGMNDEYACVIYPCSPLLEPQDLIDGYSRLKETGVDYIYSTDRKGIDCGNFYLGKTEAFIKGRPLERSSLKFYIPKDRAIDINTPEDWLRAEQMYIALRSEDENDRLLEG